MKKVLWSFLLCFVLFGGGSLLLDGDLTNGLVRGLIFGTVMAVTIGIINYFYHKSMGTNPDSSVRQEREIHLTKTYEDAFDLCVKSTALIEGTRITHKDLEKGIIQAKTKMGMRSWGDKITFHLRKISDKEVTVFVQSKPIVPTTLIDYGKNLSNIKTIAAYLEQEQEGE
ncbi:MULTISPECIES: hypothetical protein [Bacillaceae]|uniref:Uncharacterized protein n=1 Tax=Evansella alkalicola TaxID=745819 RepID=A0ABS6K043_9BACI|nr:MULTISPECIES: hypothetical protein [Bacillaceae]MBU9724220.1 hypothetical protein [Bacillus alkalicola]